MTEISSSRYSDMSPALVDPSSLSNETSADGCNALTERAERNIVIFGESGNGKSSLVNMLLGEDHAIVSSQALGCTFASEGYSTDIGGTACKIWDTAGLNEGDFGTLSAERSMDNLKGLVAKLDGNVSLLVYCIRAARFHDIWKFNYDMFYAIICDRRVPIVAVITGLENEENMDDWWSENGKMLEERGMEFKGHACITTTKGKFMQAQGMHMFEEEYKVSEEKIQTLLKQMLSGAPCAMPNGSSWMAGISKRMNEYTKQYAMRLDTNSPSQASSSKPLRDRSGRDRQGGSNRTAHATDARGETDSSLKLAFLFLKKLVTSLIPLDDGRR